MKILITGGTGILGVHLIAHLVENGDHEIIVMSRKGILPEVIDEYKEQVNIVKGDVLALYPLRDIISEVDMVIHLAAIVSFDPADKQDMFTINIEGTSNVVNSCLEFDTRLIHISSVAAIGRAKANAKISEKTEWIDTPYNTNYSKSKYLSEQEVWRGIAEGLDAVILNPSLILASGDWSMSSLKIYDQLKRGLPMYPSGSTAIVDVRDVVRFIVRMMDANIVEERFILAGHNLTFQKLFTLIADSIKAKVPSRPVNLMFAKLFWNFEKLRSFLTKSSPIITKESVVSTQHHSVYDHSKSLSIEGFVYTPLEKTISDIAAVYNDGKKELLSFD